MVTHIWWSPPFWHQNSGYPSPSSPFLLLLHIVHRWVPSLVSVPCWNMEPSRLMACPKRNPCNWWKRATAFLQRFGQSLRGSCLFFGGPIFSKPHWHLLRGLENQRCWKGSKAQTGGHNGIFSLPGSSIVSLNIFGRLWQRLANTLLSYFVGQFWGSQSWNVISPISRTVCWCWGILVACCAPKVSVWTDF